MKINRAVSINSFHSACVGVSTVPKEAKEGVKPTGASYKCL